MKCACPCMYEVGGEGDGRVNVWGDVFVSVLGGG